MLGSRATSSSDVLKIQINVRGHGREVVKKATAKGFEVIEVDGAVFYRKRKAPPAPTPRKRQHEAEQPEGDENMPPTASVPVHHAEDEHSIPEESHGLADAEDVASPCGFNMEAAPRPCHTAEDPLQALQQQLDECLPQCCPKAIAMQFALEQVLMHGAAELDRTHGASVYSQAARKVLQNVTQLLQHQVHTASSLLVQLGPRQAKPAGSSDTTQAAQQQGAQSSPGQATSSHGDPDSALARYLQHAPMVRELSQGGMLKAHLQQQLKSLEQEEAAWTGLRQRYAKEEQGQQGAEATEAAAPSSVPDQADGSAAAAAEDPSSPVMGLQNVAAAAKSGLQDGHVEAGQQVAAAAVGPSILKEVEESVNAALSVQVESLCGFLSKVEALVAKGEQACMILQADYHEDKFKTFPHVNSPAWLISQIVSKNQALLEAEEQGKMDLEQKAWGLAVRSS